MLERYFRPAYQWLLVDSLVKLLARYAAISPNLVTLLGAIFGIFSGLAMLYSPLLAMVLLLFSGYLDTVDGSLARYTQHTSDFGTVLDIFCDRIVELSVILGLCAVNPFQRVWYCLAMLSVVLLCITSFLIVSFFTDKQHSQPSDNINNMKKTFVYSPGLMERPEAFVFFLLMIVLPKFFIVLASLFSVFVLYTAIKRVFDFYVWIQR